MHGDVRNFAAYHIDEHYYFVMSGRNASSPGFLQHLGTVMDLPS
jgi:hypothetical protein